VGIVTNKKSWMWLLAIIALCSCSQARDPVSSTNALYVTPPAGVTAYFDRDVQRVFDKSCVGGCHESGGTGDSESGLRLTPGASYNELVDPTASRNGPQVIPGDPDNSLLIWKLKGVDRNGRKVFGERMPFGRPPLSEGELAAITAWIQEGALKTVAPPVPPTILSATSVDSSHLEIKFSEGVDSTTALDLTNYHFLGEGELRAIVSQLISADVVLLVTNNQTPGASYTVVVSGIKDLSGVSVREGEGDRAVFRYTPEISYQSQIQPVFNQSCAFVTCHAGSPTFSPGEGLNLDPGVSRSNLVGVSSRQRTGTQLINPEIPDQSYLLQKLQGSTGIQGERMPLGGPYLSAAEIRLINLWVEQGAIDN